MVGDVELHDPAADALQAVGLGADDHAGGDRRGAGGGRPGTALDLDEAEPAGAEGLDRMSVAQSFGIAVPISFAARMIEVPAGTETAIPSMVSDTRSPDFERGVP